MFVQGLKQTKEKTHNFLCTICVAVVEYLFCAILLGKIEVLMRTGSDRCVSRPMNSRSDLTLDQTNNFCKIENPYNLINCIAMVAVAVLPP